MKGTNRAGEIKLGKKRIFIVQKSKRLKIHVVI